MVVLKNPLLIAFEKICSLKTVHAAANDLNLTQAALTKRIRLLESELGVTLFLRSRRGMTLTQEGESLLHYCKVAGEAEGLFLSKIKGQDHREINITIAGPTSAISTRITHDCMPLYKKYPFLRLHLKSEDHLNLIEMIRRGQVDAAVVPPEQVPNEMDSKALKPDRYLLVASTKWKTRQLSEILENERIIDFYDEDQTSINYLKNFNLMNFKRRSRLFINENESLIQLFIAGVGFGTLTEIVAKPYIENGSLIKLNRGQCLESPLAFAWYPRHEKAAYFHDIIRSIK